MFYTGFYSFSTVLPDRSLQDITIFLPPLQAIILLLGGAVSVIAILVRVPGHAGAVVREAKQHHKMSLGATEWSWEERTVPTILAYSAVHYLTKFVTFQDAVQRYLAVPNHKVRQCATDMYRVMHCTLPPSTPFALIVQINEGMLGIVRAGSTPGRQAYTSIRLPVTPA